jgi:hypothetical protein
MEVLRMQTVVKKADEKTLSNAIAVKAKAFAEGVSSSVSGVEKKMLAFLCLLMSSSAFADGDVASLVTAATTEINELKGAVVTIGVILIGIAAVVGAVFLIKGSVKHI